MADTFGTPQPIAFGQIATLGGTITLPTTEDSLVGALGSTGTVHRGIVTFNRTTPGATLSAMVVAPPANLVCGPVNIPINFVVDVSECGAVPTGPCNVYVGASLTMPSVIQGQTCTAATITLDLTIIPP